MRHLLLFFFLSISLFIQGQDYEFRVQIGAFQAPKGVSDFPHAEQLSSFTMTNGVTKYFSGSFSSYQEAKEHKIMMIEAGYTESFLIVFENERIVPLSVWKKALNLEDSTSTPVASSPINLEEHNVPESIETESSSKVETSDLETTSAVKEEVAVSDMKQDAVLPKEEVAVSDTKQEAVIPKEEAKRVRNIDYDPKESALKTIDTENNVRELNVEPNRFFDPNSMLSMSQEDVANMMVYKIYIANMGDSIPEEFKKRMNLLTNLIYYYPTTEQTFIYTTGAFNTLAEAEQFHQEVIDLGFQDTRIVAVAQRVVFDLDENNLPINAKPISAVPQKPTKKLN